MKKTIKAIGIGVIRSISNIKYFFNKPGIARNQVLTKKEYEETYGSKGDYLAWTIKMDNKDFLMVYDGLFKYVTQKAFKTEQANIHRKFILSNIKVESPMVLEVGCGYAAVLAPLSMSMKGNFTGIEYAYTGIKAAESYIKNFGCNGRINLCQGDGKSIPFPDESFDVSYTNLVLERMPQKCEFLQVVNEMHRVTKYLCCFLEPWAEAQNMLTNAYLRKVNYFRDSYKILKESGFKKVKYYPLSTHHNLKYKVGYAIGFCE